MFKIKLNVACIGYHTNYITVVSSLGFDTHNSVKKNGLQLILSKNTNVF